jgi:hypothetical protein
MTDNVSLSSGYYKVFNDGNYYILHMKTSSEDLASVEILFG